MRQIYVIIPAFNEAERLRRLLPRIPQRIDSISVRTVVVSDGSTDQTTQVAIRHGATIVPLGANSGKAAALRRGLRIAERAGAGWLVTMDGDGQHDPSDLARLVRPVLDGKGDVAIGSRYLTSPRKGATPFNRYLVRRATIAWLRRVLGREHSDPYSGYRIFSRDAMRRLSLGGHEYQTELEQLFDAAESGLRVVEVPIQRVYGPGTSKMGARWGRFGGRIRVVAQYVATIVRRSRGFHEDGLGRLPAGEASA